QFESLLLNQSKSLLSYQVESLLPESLSSSPYQVESLLLSPY
ncbi:7121_t:CDS:1, partial [Racocetra persica]